MITNPEDTGIYNPRIDEYVKVDPRRRRPVLHRSGQRQRHPGHRARSRRRLRRLPLQPAQDVLQPARLRGPGDRRLSGHRHAGALPAGAAGGQDGRDVPPRLRPAAEHRPRARLSGQLDGRRARLRLDPQPGPRGPARGGRDLGHQQQLPRQAAPGRARRHPAVRRGPSPSRPGALLARASCRKTPAWAPRRCATA